MKIAINTPGGHVGRVVTDHLLRAEEQVVIISRHPGKVADLVARGARVVEGSIDDPVVLDRALDGADALYWVNPGNLRPDYDWSTRAAMQSSVRISVRIQHVWIWPGFAPRRTAFDAGRSTVRRSPAARRGGPTSTPQIAGALRSP